MQKAKPKKIKKEKPVIIFANGHVPPEGFLRKYIKNAGIIVCADGGANRIVDLNIQPDIIIGDLDSVSPETLKKLKDVIIVRRPEQESTDLQKALEYVESRVSRTRKVVVFGGTGGRLDHFLGNISLLVHFNIRLSIEFVDEKCIIRLAGKKITITGTPGQIVSLLPVYGEAAGITTTGLKFPLKNDTLTQGTRGISNEFSENKATITVRSGHVLVVILHKSKI